MSAIVGYRAKYPRGGDEWTNAYQSFDTSGGGDNQSWSAAPSQFSAANPVIACCNVHLCRFSVPCLCRTATRDVCLRNLLRRIPMDYHEDGCVRPLISERPG